MSTLGRCLLLAVVLTALALWLASVESAAVAAFPASFRSQAADAADAALSAVAAGSEVAPDPDEDPEMAEAWNFTDEDLVKLPLESIWKIADSKHGLARVAETVCTAIGNATLPSLLEGLSGKEGDLQEDTDAACGFPCRFSSGAWDAVSTLTIKERVWLGFMVLQMRNGSLHQGNGTCRAGQSPPRVLVHVAGFRGQGLGNLLQGLFTSFHVALISGRAFRMQWPRLEEAVQPRFLNWKDSVGASCTPERAELWNFGRYQENFRQTMTVANSDAAVMHLTGNWGLLPPKWGNLTGIGLPDVDIRAAFPQKGQVLGCLAHFAMGARPSLKRDVAKALDGQPGQIALQLRTGDAAKSSIGGDGRDKRPVIVNKVWGLDNPKRAATVMVECFRQLCKHLFPRGCRGFFETDNFDARRVVQGLPAEDAVVLKASGLDPKHSATDSAVAVTFASMLAMAAHDVILRTGGAVSATARQLGPAIRGGKVFIFEDFLKARAARNQSPDSVTGLCDPALQPDA